MLSRVAANLYWLSRYVERSDGMLRMLKIYYASSQDAIQELSWAPVLRIYTGLDDEHIKRIQYNSREVLSYIVAGKENLNSIVHIITSARENARSVQDHIPKDLWQCLNEYYHLVKDVKLITSLKREDPISALDVLIKQVMLYYGIAEVTMERGEGRSFMNIGKYLERSIQSVDILNSKFSTSGSSDSDELANATYWKYLLHSISGYEIYLRCYRQGFEAENVLELVVLNNDFPRSVIYSVNQISRYLDRLKQNNTLSDPRELSFLIGRLQSRIRYSTIQSIIEEGLYQYLYSVKNELYAIGNAVNVKYFAYS